MAEGVISATLVRNPRKPRRCDTCRAELGPTVRLYGCACEGDPLYVLRICVGCARESHDPKVRAIFAEGFRRGFS